MRGAGRRMTEADWPLYHINAGGNAMPTVEATYLGNLRVECEHVQSGTKIITDAPRDHHGQGQAFSPTDLCCTSLGACVMTIIGIWAAEKNIDLAGTRIEITKTMAADPRRIKKIELVYHFPPHKFGDEEKAAIERIARTAPVPLSLSENVEQEFVFKWQ